MHKGKGISGFVLVLLLIIFSNTGVTNLGKAPVLNGNVTTVHQKEGGVTAVLVNNYIPNNFKFKVRYKGGDCPAICFAPAYFCLPFVVLANSEITTGYTAPVATVHYRFFKLRGPPSVLC